MPRGSFALTKRDADKLRALTVDPTCDAADSLKLIRFCLKTKHVDAGELGIRVGEGLRFGDPEGLSVSVEVTDDHTLKLTWTRPDEEPRPRKRSRQ